jgi:hypothetical protein
VKATYKNGILEIRVPSTSGGVSSEGDLGRKDPGSIWDRAGALWGLSAVRLSGAENSSPQDRSRLQCTPSAAAPVRAFARSGALRLSCPDALQERMTLRELLTLLDNRTSCAYRLRLRKSASVSREEELGVGSATGRLTLPSRAMQDCLEIGQPGIRLHKQPDHREIRPHRDSRPPRLGRR